MFRLTYCRSRRSKICLRGSQPRRYLGSSGNDMSTADQPKLFVLLYTQLSLPNNALWVLGFPLGFFASVISPESAPF